MAKKVFAEKADGGNDSHLYTRGRETEKCSQFRMAFKEGEYWYGISEDHLGKDNSLTSYEWNRLILSS
jgi:hypothetical protein